MIEINFDKTQKTIILCSIIILAIASVVYNYEILSGILVIITLTILSIKNYIQKKPAILILIVFIFSALFTFIRLPHPDILVNYENKNLIIKGKVLSIPDKNSSNKTRFQFEVNEIIENDIPIKVHAKTFVYLDESIKQKIYKTDKLKIHAYISIPPNVQNPGQFDYKKYLQNHYMYTMASSDNIEILPSDKDYLSILIKKLDLIREKIIIKHSKYISEEKLEILGGVVFGSEAIKASKELKEAFINSGLYHLLAASGMNVGFIFGLWYFIFRKLKAPFRFTIISGGFIVIFYAMMTGLPPSITRATWMLELALLGKLIDRTANKNSILFFVCAVLLLYNPMFICDIGFLLSFVVTFGILNCSVPIMEKIKFVPQKISGWIIIPFIAQLFAMPIQMYYFQTFSLYSVLANMAVVPFMAFISFLGFISSILAIIPIIGDKICFISDKINEPFLTFMIFVAKFVSKFPNNTIFVVKPNFIEIVLFYGIVLLLIYLIKTNFQRFKLFILSLILCFILAISFTALKSQDKGLSFTFLAVGEGDCIFIKTPENKNILIDTGRYYGNSFNSGTSIILPYFKVNGINSLDLLIMTHPDSDHIAGTVDILKTIPVKRIITNGEIAENKVYKYLTKYLKENNIKPEIINGKEELSPDKTISLTAFKPNGKNPKSQNDKSLMFVIEYDNFYGIFMGDNEKDNFEEIKPFLNKKVNLFKIGHHGSKDSLTEEMITSINPDTTIISVGKNNYNHPDPEVMTLLSQREYFITETDNAIKITTDGKNKTIYLYSPIKNKFLKYKNS